MGPYKLIDHRGEVKIFEETLSDGSKVYDVVIGRSAVVIHAVDDKEAVEIFSYLSGKSITVFSDDD